MPKMLTVCEGPEPHVALQQGAAGEREGEAITKAGRRTRIATRRFMT